MKSWLLAMSLFTSTFAGGLQLAAQNSSAPPTTGTDGYIALKASEFPAERQGLIARKVELFGDFVSPLMVMVSDSGEFRDPSNIGTIFAEVVFTKVDDEDRRWMAHNTCSGICKDVFIRGTVITHRNYRGPVLEMTEISFESKAGAPGAGSEEAATLAQKEKAAPAKSVLPPGAPPKKLVVRGTAAGADPPSQGKGKSAWEQMTAHANEKQQADSDRFKVIIRGPARPENFETPYRGVRDTALWKFFEKYPYQDARTLWPRVALVVEEKPQYPGRTAEEFTPHGQTQEDLCWRLRAKIWTSSTKSTDIAPFNWCFSELRYNESLMNVATWGGRQASNMARIAAAPNAPRTLGPIPPATPFPDKSSYDNSTGYSTIMVGNILLDMAFDCDLSDGRVWLIEEIPPATHP